MGLRITEVRTLTCDRVLEVQGSPSIAVPSEVAKNHTSRVVPFLDPRVIDVVEAHRQACEGVGYVIGSPADRTKLWDKDNCQKAIAELCKEWARGTGPFLGLVGDCVVASLDPPDRAGGAAGEEGADHRFEMPKPSATSRTVSPPSALARMKRFLCVSFLSERCRAVRHCRGPERCVHFPAGCLASACCSASEGSGLAEEWDTRACQLCSAERRAENRGLRHDDHASEDCTGG